MDNFRRRIAKKDRKITGTVRYSTGMVVNSWNPPSERTFEFGSGAHYVAEENITIYYNVYNNYDDGTQEYVNSTSWTGNVTPTIITRTNSSVGQYTYDTPTKVRAGSYFFVQIDQRGYNISKSDADGTQVQFELVMYPVDRYNHRQTFGKVVLTKKGASGSGNVLASFESYT